MQNEIKITLPDEVKYVLEKLNSNGYEAFAVGGCVRDSIMGNIPNDWDICTAAKPDKISEIFSTHRIIDIGIKHGTVAVMVDGNLLEVTTYRIDGDYNDSRHPDKVLFTDLLQEDLKRRDFTVNAMAFNPSVGLIDCFDGISDINNKVLRCVGEPLTRLSEDALRILRAVRFSSKLGFSVEDKTKEAMFELKDTLNKIAVERIRVELDGILNGKKALKAIKEYSDIIRTFVPDFNPDLLTSLYGSLSVRRALFFTCAGDIEKNMTKLRYSNADISEIVALDSCKDIELKPDPILIKRLLGKIGKKNLLLLLDFRLPGKSKSFEQLVEKCSKECYLIRDLAVNGNDLMKIGFSGKDIRLILEDLLEKVITGKLPNNKKILLENIKLQED
ncbi:MAG: CCA tRNA nucleotidyltransferase [Clostridia bacterium]|nr:CCA tRNA nucleotidyltransferase [Clostridia bacterium]